MTSDPLKNLLQCPWPKAKEPFTDEVHPSAIAIFCNLLYAASGMMLMISTGALPYCYPA